MFRKEGVQSRGRRINLARAPGERILVFLVSSLGGPKIFDAKLIL